MSLPGLDRWYRFIKSHDRAELKAMLHPDVVFESPVVHTPQRGADILEQFGPSMIMVNSASDWGESSPSMLTDTMLEYRRRGHDERGTTEVFYNNPCRFFGQCEKWKLRPVAAG